MVFKNISILVISIVVLMLTTPFNWALAQEKQKPHLSQTKEQAWTFYFQRRLSEQIIRIGNNLKILKSPIGIEPSYVYVSINHPYRIMCNDAVNIGTYIAFGTGEEEDIVVHLTGIFSPDYKNEPDLKVTLNSAEVKKLDERLCRLAAEWMSKVISPQ